MTLVDMSPLLIAGRLSPPNVALLQACRELGVPARLLPPELAERRTQDGDIVLGRVDVCPSLDGIETGLESLCRLEEAGLIVLNRADALIGAHDKLETVQRLVACGIPHPQTDFVPPAQELPDVELPVVLKPRFGSWGADVVRCRSRRELSRAFAYVRGRPWFEKDGVLVQELLPTPDADLRIIVAAGTVVGAISRRPPIGEWRTNVALGATRCSVVPPDEARALAIAASAAIGADLVGVDLLPTSGGFSVLELNGCVDFTADYSLPRRDVFADAVESLLFPYAAELGAQYPSAGDDLPLLNS